ncbi:MAG: hypothetical protein ACJAR2_000093 [Ilumatobacter sp.]|jgi:hypothetical protein
MPKDEKPQIPAGWIGGIAESCQKFAYPTPDLSSLPMLKNMDNIDLLDRQQAILWPEFSWETEPGESDPKRCFQMFAPDISRVGYTDRGRVYSIICPQQGVMSPALGNINVEITVTGQRGWVDEGTRALACDMSVEARVWFGPGAEQNTAVKLLWAVTKELGHDFPVSKDKAVVVSTNQPGDIDQPIFQLLKGETSRFKAPKFACHTDEAWSVGHIEVEVGAIKQTHIPEVDKFNEMLMDILNLASGNMLKQGSVLTWNVWVNHPELVDREEWQRHADEWRRSIDVDHISIERGRSVARFYDETPFEVTEDQVNEEITKIKEFIAEQASLRRRLFRMWRPVARKLHLPKWLGGLPALTGEVHGLTKPR